MLDTRQTVREALDLLKPHLQRFLEKRLLATYGSAWKAREPRLDGPNKPDIQALPRMSLTFPSPPDCHA